MHIVYGSICGALALLAVIVTCLVAYVPVCRMKTPWPVKWMICAIEAVECAAFVAVLASVANAPVLLRKELGVGVAAEVALFALSLACAMAFIVKVLNATDRWLRPIESRYI